MSLTSFVACKDVIALLDPIIPECERQLGMVLRVPAVSKHSSLIGTAFDYLLRFELLRLKQDTVDTGWIAEKSVDLLHSQGHPMADTATRVVKGARDFMQRYKSRAKVQLQTRLALAKHAIRLAKIDDYYRSRHIDGNLTDVDHEDVDEILRLLDEVPREQFVGLPLILNPSFGAYSELVGGADADLIAGNQLVDFKTTKKPFVEKSMLRQLIGYMILIHRARSQGETLPALDSISIYFARFGYLWSMPTRPILSHQDYSAMEASFVALARGRALMR